MIKALITSLLLAVSIGHSFGYEVEPSPMDPYLIDPIYLEEYRIPQVTFATVPAGPSKKEISLAAKIDSQNVQLNLLQDQIDSIHLVLAQEHKNSKKLEFQNEQSNAALKDEKLNRQQSEGKLNWIITILGITTGLGLIFGVLWFRGRKS